MRTSSSARAYKCCTSAACLESLREECVVQRVKITGRSWWSVMIVFGTGRLHIVQGHMKCITILKLGQIPQLNEWASKRGFLALETSFSCTTAPLATNVVQSRNFWRHLASNASMNPIENLYIKRFEIRNA